MEIERILSEILQSRETIPEGVTIEEHIAKKAAEVTWPKDMDFVRVILEAFGLDKSYINEAVRQRPAFFTNKSLMVLLERLYKAAEDENWNELVKRIITVLDLQIYPNIYFNILYTIGLATSEDGIEDQIEDFIREKAIERIKQEAPERFNPLAVLKTKDSTGKVLEWPIYDSKGLVGLVQAVKHHLDQIKAFASSNKNKFKKQKKEIKLLLEEVYKVNPDYESFIDWYITQKPILFAKIEEYHNPIMEQVCKTLEFKFPEGSIETDIPQIKATLQEYCSHEKSKFHQRDTVLRNKQQVEKKSEQPDEPGQGAIESKPIFKPEIIPTIYDIIKDFFDLEQQAELNRLLETSNNVGEKLLFRDNGNRLTDTFKQLFEHNFIIGCRKKDLIEWTCENFQFNSKGNAKDFVNKTVEKNISGNEYYCKRPLIKIEAGIITKAN